MIIVTGAAGFIGSNLVRQLNARGHKDIIIVDDLTDGHKFVNLLDCQFSDYLDKDDFIQKIEANDELLTKITAIFHQGACSTTTEWDGKYMMENNYEYSKKLLNYAVTRQIPFLYASSAAVYGANQTFKEETEFERPLNVYGYSKLAFDNYVREVLPRAKSQIAGFRYFNVYGPNEQHKGSMASVAFHFREQIEKTGKARLFAGCDGYGDGEQLRDFIFVGDVVDVNCWFLENPQHSGIFNLGTGSCQSFNDVARAVIQHMGRGEIEYIPFPEHLAGAYQSFTEADMSRLKALGYDKPFMNVADGVGVYFS